MKILKALYIGVFALFALYFFMEESYLLGLGIVVLSFASFEYDTPRIWGVPGILKRMLCAGMALLIFILVARPGLFMEWIIGGSTGEESVAYEVVASSQDEPSVVAEVMDLAQGFLEESGEILPAFVTDINEIGSSLLEGSEESEGKEGSVSNSELEVVELLGVVDGDTIIVSGESGEAYVRLIGVNTPESVHTDETLNTQEGEEASAYTKALLSQVSVVYLQVDTSDTDVYGRLLRYVWLEEPSSLTEMEEVETKMLNGILLKEKVAEPVVYEPDTAYAELFTEIYED